MTFQEFMQEVELNLPGGWVVAMANDGLDTSYFANGDLGIGVRLVEQRTTLKVWARNWPAYNKIENNHEFQVFVSPNSLYPREETLSIKVSYSKTPAVVARELVRRFIGQYSEQYERCKEFRDALLDEQTQTLDGWKTLCAAFGQDSKSKFIYATTVGDKYVRFDNNEDNGLFTAHARVTPQQAIAIVNALKNLSEML